MQIVTAYTALKEVKNGVTNPYIVACDDGLEYVVKFKENIQGKRVLANEYVCAKIAEILELPLTSPSFINVDDSFIEYYGEEIAKHIEDNISSGLHFGTKKIQKTYQITSSAMLEYAVNKECIPEILLFDQLICNLDRERNDGNLIFDQIERKIIVIDHTHAFDIGAIWCEYSLHHKIGDPFFPINSEGKLYRHLIPHVQGSASFDTILEKMSRLNDTNLWDIIYNIPEEWDITLPQKEKLLEYLMDRLNRIEHALEVMKPGLPNWKGGT